MRYKEELLKFDTFGQSFRKIVGQKRFWVLGVFVCALGFIVGLAVQRWESKKTAYATLLMSSYPFANFLSTVDPENKKKLLDVQTEMTYKFHKQWLENPELLRMAYEKLQQRSGDIRPVKKVEVRVEKLSQDRAFIHLEMRHETPVDFLNTLIELYLTAYFESQIKESKNFLSKIYEKLGRLEEEIIQQEISLFDMEQGGRIEPNVSAMEKLRGYFKSLKGVRLKFQEAQREANIMSRIEAGKSVSAFTLPKSLREYRSWHQELKNLSKKYKSAHPKLRTLRRKMSRREQSIRSNLKNMKSKEGVLVGKIGALRKQISNKEGQHELHTALARSLETNKKIYLRGSERAQKVLSEGFVQNTDIQVLHFAHLTSSPSRHLSLIWNLLFGLGLVVSALSLGWITIVEGGERKRRVERETPRLNLKTLGSFPRLPEKKHQLSNEIHLLLDRNPEHPLCDEIKRMGNELLIQTQGKNISSLLFTHVGEKSRGINTMSNVGIALAHKGKRVLLIDASWNEPHLHDIFSLEHEIGLLDVLLENVKIEQAVQDTEIPNLYVLPAGSHLPNNFELLSSPSMKMLIDRLSVIYDFVFIDAPSCFEHSDIFTLAQYVRGVIMVRDSGEKLKSMLAYNSGLTRDDIEGLFWLGKVDLNHTVM